MSDSEDEELYDYSLIQFIHRGRKRKTEEVDIIPTKWLQFDTKKSKLTSKFMAPPYDGEDGEILHDFIKELAEAPADWPTYNVTLKGRAKTYDEAMSKLNRLKDEDNVLTVDSDEHVSDVQKKFENTIRQKNLLEKSFLLKTTLDKHRKSEVSAGTSKADSADLGTSVLQAKCELSYLESIDNLASDETETENELLSTNQEPILAIPSTSQLNMIQAKAQHELIKKNVSMNPSTSNHSNDRICKKPDDYTMDVPVIDLNNVIPSSQFELAVLLELREIKQTQTQICNFMMDKQVIKMSKSNTDFLKKYNMTLPLTTLEDFVAFDDRLKNDNFFKNDVCVDLTTCMDKDFVVTKSFVTMLKKFVNKNVATQFTAVRKSSDKSKTSTLKFKDTEFFECMIAIVAAKRKEQGLPSSSKDYISAISDVICNAKNWSK